jgi:hypothetical protein
MIVATDLKSAVNASFCFVCRPKIIDGPFMEPDLTLFPFGVGLREPKLS